MDVMADVGNKNRVFPKKNGGNGWDTVTRVTSWIIGGLLMALVLDWTVSFVSFKTQLTHLMSTQQYENATLIFSKIQHIPIIPLLYNQQKLSVLILAERWEEAQKMACDGVNGLYRQSWVFWYYKAVSELMLNKIEDAKSSVMMSVSMNEASESLSLASIINGNSKQPANDQFLLQYL